MAQKLPWLQSGLYRLLFGRELSTAVAVAPELLAQAQKQQSTHDAAARLDSIVKLVTGVAAELSDASLFWQWCFQLLLLHTVRELRSTCKLLEAHLCAGQSGSSPPSNSIVALPSAPSGLHFELQEICWGDLIVNGSLGCGSFGAVFSAWWKGALVAVKCIELGLGSSKQQVLEDMEREAKLMAFKNNHPNIVRFLAVCRDKPAIIMELCTAGSMHKQIERHQSLNHAPQTGSNVPDQLQQPLITPLRVIKILHDAAAAMDYLHTVNAHGTMSAVLHCDLRSPNLLLAGNSQRPEEWSVRIADFGLAQWVGPDGCTHTDKITNHLWVAPEVLDLKLCQNMYKVSKAADVYAFGAVMRELLTGRLPHVNSNMTPKEVALLGLAKPCEVKGCLRWPSHQELLPGLDCQMIQHLRPLFEGCVSKDAQIRPSFQQVQQELASVLAKARAELAASAPAAMGPVNVQPGGGIGVCYASLGPSSCGSATPPAPDSWQYSSPFLAAKGQNWLVNSSVQSSAHAASMTLVTATAVT